MMDPSVKSSNTTVSDPDKSNRDRSKENIERIKNKQIEERKTRPPSVSESMFRS